MNPDEIIDEIVERYPAGLTLVRLTINVGMHPWSLVQTQQTTLGGSASHPAVTVRTSVEQGEVGYWSVDSLKRAHSAMTEAAARGKPTNDPRDLLNIPMTRTHAWNFLYRRLGANGQPPSVEFHAGPTTSTSSSPGRARS